MKRALVISGGGSKGAYALGVIDQLRSNFSKLEFDCFVGTSTGALISPFAALGEFELLNKIYTSTKTKHVLKKHNIGTRLSKKSVFEVKPLWNLLGKNLTDKKCNTLLNDSDKEIVLTTTCLQTGKLAIFTTKESHKEDDVDYDVFKIQNPDHFRRAILASSCQPVFMNPVKVNKSIPNTLHPNYQYVDGGMVEFAGLEMAIDCNAEEIFAILLSEKVKLPVQEEYKNLFGILQRSIDIFSDDIQKNDLVVPQQYNEALEYIEAVKNKMSRNGISSEDINKFFDIRGRKSPFADKKPINIHVIRPNFKLNGGPGGLDFVPKNMKEMVDIGKQAGTEFIAGLDSGDISWA
jgi:predicted acylesterase/phospholipase RssA